MEMKPLADPFINLANSFVDKGQEPEMVGDGMMWGTARYMAFLITRLSHYSQLGRGPMVEKITEAFRDAVQHHLSQMAGPLDEADPEHPPPHDHGLMKDDDGMAAPFDEAYGPLLRSMMNIDVVLVAYLRGRGETELADRLALHKSEVDQNPNWDVQYAKRLYAEMEDGTLPEAIAISTIASTLMPRFQASTVDGYVRDPLISDEARKEHSSFYAQFQLHKLATMMRKDPARMLALGEEGDDALLGPRMGAARKIFSEMRARKAH